MILYNLRWIFLEGIYLNLVAFLDILNNNTLNKFDLLLRLLLEIINFFRKVSRAKNMGAFVKLAQRGHGPEWTR